MIAKIYNSDKIRKIRRKLYRGRISLDEGSGSLRMCMYIGQSRNAKVSKKGVKIFDGIVKLLRKQRYLTSYNPKRTQDYVRRFRKEDTLTKRRDRSYKRVIKNILSEE